MATITLKGNAIQTIGELPAKGTKYQTSNWLKTTYPKLR